MRRVSSQMANKRGNSEMIEATCAYYSSPTDLLAARAQEEDLDAECDSTKHISIGTQIDETYPSQTISTYFSQPGLSTEDESDDDDDRLDGIYGDDEGVKSWYTG